MIFPFPVIPGNNNVSFPFPKFGNGISIPVPVPKCPKVIPAHPCASVVKLMENATMPMMITSDLLQPWNWSYETAVI